MLNFKSILALGRKIAFPWTYPPLEKIILKCRTDKPPYYGCRRIIAQLRREKVRINLKRVLRMMRDMGIQGRIKHKYI